MWPSSASVTCYLLNCYSILWWKILIWGKLTVLCATVCWCRNQLDRLSSRDCLHRSWFSNEPWQNLQNTEGSHLSSLAPRRGCNIKLVIFSYQGQNQISWVLPVKLPEVRWMPQDLTVDYSTFIQVMAWYHQATSHCLHQCWPTSMMLYTACMDYIDPDVRCPKKVGGG